MSSSQHLRGESVNTTTTATTAFRRGPPKKKTGERLNSTTNSAPGEVDLLNSSLGSRRTTSIFRRPGNNRKFKKSESLAVSDAVSDAEASPITPPKDITPPKAMFPKRPPLHHIHHIRSESPPASDKRKEIDIGRSSGPAKYEQGSSTQPGAAEFRKPCGTAHTSALERTRLSLERTRQSTTFPRFPLRERRRLRSSCDVLSDPPCVEAVARRATEDSSTSVGGEGGGGEEGGGPTATLVQAPLVDILENRSPEPMSLRSLLLYAKRNLMDENILFFLEVSCLKSAGGGQTQYLSHVKRIYNLYIKPSSPREVNISGDIHIATSAAVHDVLNRPREEDDSCDSDTSTRVKVGSDAESLKSAEDRERLGGGREAEGVAALAAAGRSEALRSVRADAATAAGGGGGGLIGGEAGERGGRVTAATVRATRPTKRPNSQRLASREGSSSESSYSSPDARSRRHSRSMSLPGMSPLFVDAKSPTAPPTAESALGESALGDTALGDTALGDTALGDTALLIGEGSAFLGGESNALGGERVDDDSGSKSAARFSLEENICFQGPSKVSGTAFATGRRTREPSPVASVADGDSSTGEREARADGGGGGFIRRRRDHVKSTWISDPDDVDLEARGGGGGLDASGEIERLSPGGGPGGGFGDRSIFDSAQGEIYDILRTEVYPKFAANVFAQSRESSPTPVTQDVNSSAKTRGSATNKVKVLMKAAFLSMRPS